MLSISQESNDRKLSFPPPTLNIGIEYLKKKSISYRQVINKNPAVITTQDFLLCIAEISSALKIVELKDCGVLDSSKKQTFFFMISALAFKKSGSKKCTLLYQLGAI